MRLVATAVAALCLANAAALADPVGQYGVTGTNPGNTGSAYSGTVAVQRTGDTYQVTWLIGGTRFVGTGIGSQDFLAVSYRSKNLNGLALYAGQPDGSWQGIWTYDGGSTIGTEKWMPK
jgi:hypothetical protein